MTDVMDRQGRIAKQNVIGARFKAARESMQLSEKDAAARLYLNPRIITLIELEDLDNAPPATFLRGYFRSYARLLNISEAEVNNALDQLGINAQPAAALSSIFVQAEQMNHNSHRYVNCITFLIISLLAILVGVWWNGHSTGYSVSQLLTQTTVQPFLHPETQKAVSPTAPVSTMMPDNAAIHASPNLNRTAIAPNEPLRVPSANNHSLESVPARTEQTAKEANPSHSSTHQQTLSADDVSGMVMQLPEPGLESSETHSERSP